MARCGDQGAGVVVVCGGRVGAFDGFAVAAFGDAEIASGRVLGRHQVHLFEGMGVR